jgi:threonine dehydrogenase-like Zn-dependent dehydrogenase
VSSAEVLDVMAAGVCGSDTHRLRAGFDVRSLGHELVGRRLSNGTLVAIRPLNPCRACPACRRGWTEHVVTMEDLPVTHYDVVLEAVGGISSAPILTAILAVAPLGQVVALGVYRPDLAAVIPVRTLLEKESTLRGSKAYRVSAERDDFATALEHLATCRDAYSPIITCTPPWSPDDPQPPELERRNGTLKTVYVKEHSGPHDA